MSDNYRDGCSKRLGVVLLMMPWALFMYVRDSRRARRTARL